MLCLFLLSCSKILFLEKLSDRFYLTKTTLSNVDSAVCYVMHISISAMVNKLIFNNFVIKSLQLFNIE